MHRLLKCATQRSCIREPNARYIKKSSQHLYLACGNHIAQFVPHIYHIRTRTVRAYVYLQVVVCTIGGVGPCHYTGSLGIIHIDGAFGRIGIIIKPHLKLAMIWIGINKQQFAGAACNAYCIGACRTA